MKLHHRFLLATVFAGSLLATAPLFAQAPMGGGPMGGGGMNAAMMKLYGDVKHFTAKAEMRMLDGSGKESMMMPVTMAFSEGKGRMEMDMTQMKSAMLPPGATEQMKTMGLDRVVSLSRPNQKTACMVYPGLQAYLEIDLPKETAEASEGDFKIQKTELGKETVDGHPCVKNKFTITDSKGKTSEATAWNATDLKDFPIKTEMADQGMKVVMTYKDVKFATSDASQFDPPASFKKCTSQQELMQAAMQKMMSSGGFPGAPGKK